MGSYLAASKRKESWCVMQECVAEGMQENVNAPRMAIARGRAAGLFAGSIEMTCLPELGRFSTRVTDVYSKPTFASFGICLHFYELNSRTPQVSPAIQLRPMAHGRGFRAGAASIMSDPCCL